MGRAHIGYGNHDCHSLVQGYDGKFEYGGSGFNVLTKEGRRVSNPIQAVYYGVTQTEPSSRFLRRVFETAAFDFDNYGNIFAIDHDVDFQGERERLVYLPEGWTGMAPFYQYRNTTLVKAARDDLYNPWFERCGCHFMGAAISPSARN